MKRITARILACIMFLSTLQGGQILWAAQESVQGFEVSRKMLQEDSTGLSEKERDETAGETALIKWNISTAAKYILSYYIEAEKGMTTVTKKVDIEVDNLDKTNIELGITTATSGDSIKDNNHYVERVFDNTSFTWKYGMTDTTGPGGKIEKDLKMGSGQSRADQEYNIELTDITMKLDGNSQDNLKLKFKISGDYLIVYTNGIARGNVTPFELSYGDITSTAVIASEKIFNGPKNYTITPTHLYMKDGKLTNLTTITDITTTKPGSVPGIKVSFAQIKEIDSGIFKYIDEIVYTDPNTNPNITLQLGTRYTLGSMTNAIRLDFTPTNKGDRSVEINSNKSVKNAVSVESDNTVSIYLSQKELQDANDQIPIVWDVLDTSTIVDGSFQYGDQAEQYWPANKGYTYLGYSFNKTRDNQVQLNIQPYNINATATYSIYILSNPNTQLSSPQVVYEYDPSKTDTSNITAIIPAGSPSYFKVVVSIDTNTFESQMVYYHPDKYPTVPQVTQIKSIDNVYVVPNENSNLANTQPQAIGFDIEWLAPDNVESLLKGNKLYYELLLRKDKEDYDPISNTSSITEDIYATYSKVFEVSLNAAGKVVVNTVAGTAGGANDTTPELRYNQTNGSFTMEGVSLMNYDETTDNWEQLEITENHLATTSENYLLSVLGKEKNSLSNRLVPGTYYLSFRTVLVSDTAGTPIVYSEESNMVSLTLDNSNEIIPVPSTITATDTTDSAKTVISEQITINNVDIRNYVKKMLEPTKLKLYTDAEKITGRYSGTYEIYLYQKSDQLTQTIEKVENGSITPVEITHEGVLNLLDDKKYIADLRNGEVVPIILKTPSLIGDGNRNFEIKGLDENEVYYMQIRVKLSPWRNSIDEMNSSKVPSRYSLFSKEITFTTTATPVPPSPEDKVPPAPDKIWIEEQKSNTTVTLGWVPADFEPDTDIKKTYYEFIRTKLQLTSAEKGKDIEALVEADKTRVGFRSDDPNENNPYMSTYLSAVKGWINLEPSQESSLFRLTDDTLQPNTVYYYYVRTVCIIDGSPIKSTWIMVPVTTSPVGIPINLKIETAKNYSHDTKDETVISFDAPIPSDASVPNDYDFDIAVQGEMDDSYSTTTYKVTKLTSKEDASLTPEGYTHFVYKITGLKPNKRYFIKVRVVDKTSNLTDDNEYPTSLYCNPVSTRTEYDEEEDNKDNKFEEYIKQFENEAEKLKEKPYWIVQEGNIYKYRESYITSDIGLKKEYELVVEDDREATYYLPVSVFTKANEIGTTLKITLGDYSANIRPYTLIEENEEIAEAIELISKGSLKDYYVELKFSLSSISDSINGQKAVTPRMTIDMNLVYLKEKDSVIEADIMDALDELITSEKENVVEALEKKIYNGTIADDVLQDIIDEAIEDVEASHIKKVKRIINTETKKNITIDKIEKGILLLSKADVYAADAYYLKGSSWTSVESYKALDGFAIEGTFLGTYVLVGQGTLINTVPSLAPYQSFIAKYNLTDFFTLDSYMIQTATTKEQLYGSVARLLGAQRGVDYYTYLQGKKIKGLASLGKQNAVRQDEEIYIIMQAYEILYNRPIKSVVIKNKQSVQNIGAFQSIYRDYIYAAVELKIVTPTNAKVVPSKQMTVEETIIMLYKMQAR